MATTNIQYSKSSDMGLNINVGLSGLHRDRDRLNSELAVMRTMITGDASTIDQFDIVVQNGGYGGWTANNAVTDSQRTAAKASWDELNSLLAKLNAPSGTGDSTGAALDQCCAKHGVV